MKRNVIMAVAALAIGACGERDAGPHEHEYGEITFWLVTGSNVSFATCTDSGNWQAAVEPPAIEENSFLIYLLSEDGTTAAAQDCTTTKASSCGPSSTGIVFEVSGHTLTYDSAGTTRPIQGSTCELEGDELWTITDLGETASMAVDIAFGLVGDPTACAQLDADVIADSSNGNGIDGCVVTLGVEMEFHSSSRP
ncbi:MAG: hypothetical protein V3T05_05285 [Myxococcota bacterium]